MRLWILTVATLLLMISQAQAELVNCGDFTQDTQSGLDWLDWTITRPIDRDEFLAGAGGWLGAGWRMGTIAEGCDLLDQFTDSGCPAATIVAYESIEGAVALFGATFFVSEFDFGAFGHVSDPPHTESASLMQFKVQLGTPSVQFSNGSLFSSGGVALVRPNSCDPLIPGSCQGSPIPPPSPCVEQPDGSVECPPMICGQGCRQECIDAGIACNTCACSWKGPVYPSLPPPGPIVVYFSLRPISPQAFFLGIDEFPAGALEPMTVFVNGQILGPFDEGDSLDFTTLPGPGGLAPLASTAGATEFAVMANMADPEAFALIAPLDTEGAEFTITVPEPGMAVGLIAGLGALVGLGTRRRT